MATNIPYRRTYNNYNNIRNDIAFDNGVERIIRSDTIMDLKVEIYGLLRDVYEQTKLIERLEGEIWELKHEGGYVKKVFGSDNPSDDDLK